MSDDELRAEATLLCHQVGAAKVREANKNVRHTHHSDAKTDEIIKDAVNDAVQNARAQPQEGFRL